MRVISMSLTILNAAVLSTPQRLAINNKINSAIDSKTVDVNDQLIDLKHFRFIKLQVPTKGPDALRTKNIQRTCCKEMYNKCPENFFLIMFVMSTIDNFDNRDAIRKTWGQESKCIKVFYLLGISKDKKFTKKIYNENQKYRDIIQGNFLDTYRNLTYKHVMALKWVTYYCKQAKYIVKTDDDIVVNTDLLFEKLKTSYWRARDLIACKLFHEAPVHREHKSIYSDSPKDKWIVTKEEFPFHDDDIYPDYCQGAFTIYSADVVRRLLKASRNFPYFWLEDVHVTGTLAKNIRVKHKDIHAWRLADPQELLLLGPNKTKPFLYGPIDLYPKDIVTVWRALKGLKGAKQIKGNKGRMPLGKIKSRTIAVPQGLTKYLELLESGKIILRN